MNPDFNSDGVVDEMERTVYDKLKGADVDGDGYLTRKEMYMILASSMQELKEARKGGIPITTLNPDADGDGKVEKWEVDVFERIKAADEDKSGAISVKELFGVIKGAAESDKQKKLFRRLFFVALLVIFALIGAMLGMGIVAGEAVKEAKVPDCSDPAVDDPRCDPAKVVQAGQVESFVTSIFDLPTVPVNQLAYMRDITFYVDMTAHPIVGGPAEATFKLAGAYKRSDTQAYLRTIDGHTIALDAVLQSGTITMDGVSYAVSEQPPATSGRRLETSNTMPVATQTAKQLARQHLEARRLNMFSGALLTSGSFTMMASAGYRRRQLREVEELREVEGRQLNMFSGALLTSGSFTMMASAGY